MTEYVSSVLRASLGIAVFLGACWCFSENRGRINWRLVFSALALQFTFAALVLRVPYVGDVFNVFARFFVRVTDFSFAGARFLFGSLVENQASFGYIFAFQVLPTIIFFAALSSVLYYIGVLQKIVFGFAWVMSKTMRLSGAESLSTAANIFLGQTEAPLMIRPYLAAMSRSEMMCVMVGGMATIAGGVLAAYIGMLGGSSEEQKLAFARHLLTASILAAPATILVAKMLVPETEVVDQRLDIPREKIGSNLVDAAIVGSNDGLMLSLNVAAALIAFTALVAMVNYGFNALGDLLHWNTWVAQTTHGTYQVFSLQYVLGLLFSPVAWLIGIPTGDLLLVGQLLGERTVLNEFFAYDTLSKMKAAGTITSPRSVVLATYALCGFANIVSMGIQVGGIGALVPSQRSLLASLAFKAMCGGVIACLMTACFASFFIEVPATFAAP